MSDGTPTLEVDPGPMYWVEIEGRAEGPHTGAYLSVLLEQHRITSTSLVCKVGEAAWLPLQEVQSLTSEIGILPNALPPPLPARPKSKGLTVLLARIGNRELPVFANIICAYCLILCPVLEIASLSLSVAGFNSASDLLVDSPLRFQAIGLDIVTALSDLASTALFVLGGLLLRRRRVGCVGLVRTAIIVSFVLIHIYLMDALNWSALISASEQYPPENESASIIELVYGLAGLGFFLIVAAALLFQAVALVWISFNVERIEACTTRSNVAFDGSG